MRITINIDDQLMMYAKLLATQQGCTLNTMKPHFILLCVPIAKT
jgi:hypothetical protein